ncbi:MAG: hypothetical protein M3Q07_02325 [Pseudobdellovibrionaceae bacterium]|nr:hypothetical protein [Pseudobdellovibrionaceae bacterium]
MAEQLTVFNSKPSRLSDLKQKAQRMALSFPPYKKIGTVLPTLPSEDKIYKDVATVDASRDRALSEKTHALDRSLKSSILAKNADQYAMTMSRLFALQDLGQEAAQKSAKIIQGYHAYGILKGFSIDRLTDRLFPAAFLENHSGFDLIGLNKIILLAEGRNDQERIVALLFLVRSSLAARSEDTRLLPDSLYQRLKRQDNLQSIISDLTPLGEFGHTEKQVREEIARAIQIWKGDF